MGKLVSILTPCYNGDKIIWRLLDSILNQTYPEIEMFVIDDGSTDNSANLIKTYIPKFELKGYSLTYIYQENSGQSVAINNGLKLIKGDYLVWPDCDDWYATNDAIQQMVEVLDNSAENVSMVRCQSNLIDEDTLKQVGKFGLNKKTKGKTNLFEDCLLAKNRYWYVPGDYMAKTKKIDETIPNREIYTEKNAGQNWQLMLPLLYKNECLTIEKNLYNVLVREDSHSRGLYSTLDQQLQRYDSYEKTLLATIDNIVKMPVTEKHKYEHTIKNNYNVLRFNLFMSNKKFKGALNMFFKSNISSKNGMFIKVFKRVIKKIYHFTESY